MDAISILLADDDRDHRSLLRASLAQGGPGWRIRTAQSGAGLVRLLDRRRYDCVVVDFHLGDTTADRALRDAAVSLGDTPVIVVSSSDEQRVVVAAFRSGVVDFINKEDAVVGTTLADRVERAVAESRQRRADRRRAQRRERALLRLAETDPLTGLANRRRAERLFGAEARRADRRARTGLALLDIDRFKAINDRYGHDVGDRAIRAVADAIRAVIRPGDLAVRWGGEEFLILRPSAGTAETWLLAEAIRERIARIRVETDEGPLRITASAGVASVQTGALREDAVGLADHALYLAKDRGRDRVCSWDMVAAQRAAGAVQIDATRSPHAAREAFVRQLTGIGPTQREHVTAHCDLVRRLACGLAQRLGLSDADRDALDEAALLHDIGKAATPEDLLALDRGLTADELRILAGHASEGAMLAQALGATPRAVGLVLRHHERFDETASLDPDADPVLNGVLAVADAVAAMGVDRSYRRARTHDEIRRELRHATGAQFDPAVVDAACDPGSGLLETVLGADRGPPTALAA